MKNFWFKLSCHTSRFLFIFTHFCHFSPKAENLSIVKTCDHPMSATPRGKNILLFFGTWCNLISRCPWSLRSLRSSGETDSFSKEDFYISTLRLQALAEVVSCCSEPDGLWKFFGSELFSQKFICLRFHMNPRRNALLWWRAEPEREKQKPVFDLWPQAPLMVFTRQTQTWISSTAALKTLHQQPAHIWAGRLCESLTSLFILRTVWQWGRGRGLGGGGGGGSHVSPELSTNSQRKSTN